MRSRWCPESTRSPRVPSAVASRPRSEGGGYVVQSLEAALWAFDRSSSFREGALLAVNLGDDADTTGAVYGQLAGAFHGEDAIPPRWREQLAMGDFIGSMAERLAAANPDRSDRPE